MTVIAFSGSDSNITTMSGNIAIAMFPAKKNYLQLSGVNENE
jgi:hypothetical protein